MSKTNDCCLVNLERMMDDLDEVNSFTTGYHGNNEGITRRSFTDEDQKARAWLVEKMTNLGLDVVVDGFGNVRGTLAGIGKAVVTGSHLDTIPNGGRYDGILGIISALETVRVIKERELKIKHPIEIVAFTDEEERFMSFLGSYAYTGELDVKLMELLADSDGISLAESMDKYGFDPKTAIVNSKADLENIKAFVELHVEQGPLLERHGNDIGVVDSVMGDYRYGISIVGKTDHAGFPMEGRSDAFLALYELLTRINALTKVYIPKGLLYTIGSVKVSPGLENVVPGGAYCSIDLRIKDGKILNELDRNIKSFIDEIIGVGKFSVNTEHILRLAPVPMDENICSTIEACAEEVGITHVRMSSGAGHDAQIMAQKVPTAMIFVPSEGGRSHRPDEYTSPEDIRKGAEVLLRTILRLAR